MKTKLLALTALLTVPLLAGGPLSLGPGRVPTTWDPSQPVTYSVEAGALNAELDNATAVQMVHDEFAEWNEVAGDLLTIEPGLTIGNDIKTMEELEDQVVLFRRQPIIFDENGSLFEEFGADANVLAFTSVSNQGSDFYNVAFVIFGGPAMTNFSSDHVRTIMLHEFGHFLGLGHSVVNGDMRAFGDTLPGFGAVPEDAVEIMYWSINPNDPAGRNSHVKQDDISAFLGSYSDHPQGLPGRAAISGTVTDSDGSTAVRGVGIVVRDHSAGADSVYHVAAGDITGVGGEGAFNIGGLPAGDYSVQTYDVGFRNDGAYWDPGIRTNNEGNPTSPNLGPFPGEEEFYNGTNESNDPAVDDPTEMELVTLNVSQTRSEINIHANRQAGVQGSTLPFSYILPDMQADDDDQTTAIGVINTTDFQQTIEFYGFNSSGLALPKADVIQSLPPKGKAFFSIRQAYPGAADSVAWSQIGSTGELLVFSELRDTQTRSAYWATDALLDNIYMPHIASDTESFETRLSAVNPTSLGEEATLTLLPPNIKATLTQTGEPYGKFGDPLTVPFGTDLEPNIWARLTTPGPILAASESFTTLPARDMSAALGLNSQSGQTLRFLHVATDVGQFWTGLVYINVSDLTAQVTETFYNAAGEVLSTSQSSLTKGGKVTLLFDAQNQERVPAGTSWVEVNADRQLIGYELFGTPAGVNNDTFTGLQGSYSQGSILDFPHFVSTDDRFTAIVAVNVGEEAADLNLTIYDEAGHALETVTLQNLAPKTKVARLVRDLGISAETRAAGAWIRAVATGSSFAGFTLWGDQGGESRHFLSGVTAVNRADGVLLEIEDNNSYDTAQVLERGPNGWDVRLVGEISKSDTGAIVNTSAADDIEDIYTFTLDQPTELVVAISPENQFADLDLLIFSNQLADGQFYSVDPSSHSQVTFSANLGGDESVARLFPPGTYYIMVSLFETDPVSTTDYGLVVQEAPIVLDTFETDASLDDWHVQILATDSDGQSGLTISDELALAGQGTHYGNSLKSEAVTQGDTEGSLLHSDFFTVPAVGVTLFECDLTVVDEGSTIDPRLSMGVLNTALEITAPDTRIPFFLQFIPITLANESLQWLTWSSWVGYANNALDNVDRTNHTTTGREGEQVAIGLQARTNRDIVFFDNVRVVNIQTTATPGESKRNGTLVSSTKSKFPKRRFSDQQFKVLKSAKK